VTVVLGAAQGVVGSVGRPLAARNWDLWQGSSEFRPLFWLKLNVGLHGHIWTG
jgi:hypothetical protein